MLYVEVSWHVSDNVSMFPMLDGSRKRDSDRTNSLGLL